MGKRVWLLRAAVAAAFIGGAAFAQDDGCRRSDAARDYLQIVDDYCHCQDAQCVEKARARIHQFDTSRLSGDDYKSVISAFNEADQCAEKR